MASSTFVHGTRFVDVDFCRAKARYVYQFTDLGGDGDEPLFCHCVYIKVLMDVEW